MLRSVVFSFLAASAALAQGSFDRTVPVSGSPDLYVSTGSGHIRIVPSEGSQIHISARLKPGSHAGSDIQQRIQQIVNNPPIQVSGNSVRVGDNGEQRGLYNNIMIDYDISAPRNVAVNLRSGSGDIQVDSLVRFAKVDTGSGSIRVHGVAGPADLHAGSGDVELEERGSGEVRANSGSGSVRINGLNGAAHLRSGSGDLELSGQITGPSEFQTGSGSVRLHLGSSARFNLDATTGSGSIRVAQSTSSNDREDRHHVSAAVNGGGPEVRAVTGSGDININ